MLHIICKIESAVKLNWFIQNKTFDQMSSRDHIIHKGLRYFDVLLLFVLKE